MQASLSTLAVFRLLTAGFANRDLRALLVRLLGVAPDTMTAGSLTSHLRRLRLHGLIVRIDGTHRYRVTDGESGWTGGAPISAMRPCPLLGVVISALKTACSTGDLGMP